MKLYSWNMLYRNPDPERAFSFVKGLDFDILCLQEVPGTFLERLKTLPCEITFGIDADRIEDDGNVTHTYCVILSRRKILGHRDFPFPPLLNTARTRLFIRLMRPWGWQRITNPRSLYADIDMPTLGRVRVFSVHLTLSYPERILQEFGIAAALRSPSTTNIICGDLNVIESPHVSILNWILGGRFRDIFAWRSGRRDMEKKFSELGLQNPLRGTRTQTISCSQLDHILIPNDIRVTRAEVVRDRYGSDHHFVFVECAKA
jgi:endonuclease/exonuclease/phosphatase family metal-dependent hydrolase